MQSATLRSLRDTTTAILYLEPHGVPITHQAIAELAELSPRQIARCIRILKAQAVLSLEPDLRWRGPGRVYRYTIEVERALDLGIIRHAA